MLKIARVLLFVLLASLLPTPARADCYPIASAPLGADCVVMPFGDARGVWFSLDVAAEIRRDRSLVPELQFQLDRAEELSEIRGVQVSLLTRASRERERALSQALAANATLFKLAQKARSERLEALEKANAWHRSPLLWLGIGVVGSLLAVGTVAYSSKF